MERLKIYDRQRAAQYTEWDIRPYLEQLVNVTTAVINNRHDSPNTQALDKLRRLNNDLWEGCRLLADEIEVQL